MPPTVNDHMSLRSIDWLVFAVETRISSVRYEIRICVQRSLIFTYDEISLYASTAYHGTTSMPDFVKIGHWLKGLDVGEEVFS